MSWMLQWPTSPEKVQDKANHKKEAANKFMAKAYKKRKGTPKFYMKRAAAMPSISTTTAEIRLKYDIPFTRFI